VEYYPGMLTLPNAIEGGTVEVVGLTDDALPAGFEKDAEGNIYVAKGTTFTVKATPDEGYHFVCWSDDETNTNPEREITMPAQDLAFSATAIFAENEYDITFSEGTNPDPENPEWTATPNPAKTKQTVTVTYTGSKKVIGVKAEKKAAAPTLKDALANGATVVINYTWFDENVTTFTYTNNGGTYTGNTTGVDAGYFTNGMSMSGTTLRFTASNTDATEANVSIDFYTDTNEYYFNSKDTGFTSFTISVNGTDLTSQLKEVK
jgi:phage terminase large subunit-like protein